MLVHNQVVELSLDKKKEIEQRLVETVISSLEKGELTTDDYSKVSSLILEKMKTVTTQEQLAQFLKDLSAKYPIFSKMTTLHMGEEQEKKDEKTTQDVVKLAESGKIEDAITLAKTVTGGLK